MRRTKHGQGMRRPQGQKQKLRPLDVKHSICKSRVRTISWINLHVLPRVRNGTNKCSTHDAFVAGKRFSRPYHSVAVQSLSEITFIFAGGYGAHHAIGASATKSRRLRAQFSLLFVRLQKCCETNADTNPCVMLSRLSSLVSRTRALKVEAGAARISSEVTTHKRINGDTAGVV